MKLIIILEMNLNSLYGVSEEREREREEEEVRERRGEKERERNQINIITVIIFSDPPAPPSTVTINRLSSCTINISWTLPAQADPSTAPTSTISLTTQYCDPVDGHCLMDEERLYPLTTNSTSLLLVPNKEYTFSVISNNVLIGRGVTAAIAKYYTIDDGKGNIYNNNDTINIILFYRV